MDGTSSEFLTSIPTARRALVPPRVPGEDPSYLDDYGEQDRYAAGVTRLAAIACVHGGGQGPPTLPQRTIRRPPLRAQVHSLMRSPHRISPYSWVTHQG